MKTSKKPLSWLICALWALPIVLPLALAACSETKTTYGPHGYYDFKNQKFVYGPTTYTYEDDCCD